MPGKESERPRQMRRTGAETVLLVLRTLGAMKTRDDELEHLRREVERLREENALLSSPLATLLKTRGYHLYRKNRHEDPLIPAKRHHEEFFELMRNYSFRLFLRDVIKRQARFSVNEVTRYATREVTEHYVRIILRMKLIERDNGGYRATREATSFGPTLEWFVAGLLEREYHTEVIWGASFKRPRVGGDYDVIAKLGCRIVYLEVKSSPPKQVYQGEIAAFLQRVEDLAPEIAVFFMDTELRMKDKIVPMFEAELGKRPDAPSVIRMQKELFHVSHKIFIMNAKGGIEGNLAQIIRWYFLYNKS